MDDAHILMLHLRVRQLPAERTEQSLARGEDGRERAAGRSHLGDAPLGQGGCCMICLADQEASENAF